MSITVGILAPYTTCCYKNKRFADINSALAILPPPLMDDCAVSLTSIKPDEKLYHPLQRYGLLAFEYDPNWTPSTYACPYPPRPHLLRRIAAAAGDFAALVPFMDWLDKKCFGTSTITDVEQRVLLGYCMKFVAFDTVATINSYETCLLEHLAADVIRALMAADDHAQISTGIVVAQKLLTILFAASALTRPMSTWLRINLNSLAAIGDTGIQDAHKLSPFWGIQNRAGRYINPDMFESVLRGPVGGYTGWTDQNRKEYSEEVCSSYNAQILRFLEWNDLVGPRMGSIAVELYIVA